MERKMKECLDACLACISACNHCLDACLEEEHAAMMKACIRLDRDCADLCGMAIQMMTRNSPFVKEFMLLCAQACDLCAEECAKHDHDHCQACAEACRACSRACMAMAV
ncbi:four-helix bundle copper-binding protein [Paenibacillus albicereus]|uniref:Four-helix bundle copper-binding protein n=2 Tax=Paenibacillus albicereus TaxID=2726185 RepID=A0A6H2H419_9BACL|nr:four-helix bundle copper-binding protein [Paenibacillus albicereus]QJC54339.1 four-helix bundle copper-binding protein [Paenibacillus albicereus]